MSIHSSEILLKIKNLRVQFLDSHEGVKDISLHILPGETVGLLGQSGSGKTLTGLSIMGLCPKGAQVSGEILFRQRDLLQINENDLTHVRGSQIAMIFQEPMTALNPVMPILDQVAEGIITHQKVSLHDAKERALELLKEVGLKAKNIDTTQYPHQLSGGEKQRVMIAMALACRPQLLIADEPTTSLDMSVQKQILDLLLELQNKYGMALLFISHDLKLIRKMTKRVYVLSEGSVIESGQTKEICDKLFLSQNPLNDRTSNSLAVSDVLVEIKNLSVTFDRKSAFWRTLKGRFTALDEINLSVFKARIMGLVGESGSGKTTLAKVILNLIKNYTGHVVWENMDVKVLTEIQQKAMCKKIQIIFQDPYSSLNSKHTIRRALIEPMEVHGLGRNSQERESRAQELMKKVGLDPQWLERYPQEFSGGQRQRICIARALSVEPEVLICDESVSALDTSSKAQILDLLKKLNEELKLTIIFISHDLSVVRSLCDDLVVLKDGKVIESGLTKDIFNSPKSSYARELLEAVIN